MLTTAAAAAVGLSRHAGATPGRAGALAAGSAGRVRDSRRHAHRRRAGQGCARLRRRLCCPVRQPCPAALRYPRCAGGGARGSWCSRRCVTPNVAPVSLWFAELTCRRSVRYSAAGWPSRRSREPSSTPAWACGRRARCGRLWLRSSNAVVAPPLSSESSWLARLPATGAFCRAAIREVGAGAWSAPECEVGELLRAAELPAFEQNVDVYDAAGNWLACGDVVWRQLRAILEVDSRAHHADPQAWERTLQRHNLLAVAGWALLHYPPGVLRADGERVIIAVRRRPSRPRRCVPRVRASARSAGTCGGTDRCPQSSPAGRWRSASGRSRELRR